MKIDSRTNRLPLDEIFSNIQDVVRINQVLLKNIETEMNRWDNSNSLLGRIFMDLVHNSKIATYRYKGPYLKPYYIKYTENYAHAIEVLSEAEKSKEFVEWQDVRTYCIFRYKPSLGSCRV
jgi:ADP-glucose pyrophosphorylase